MQYKIELQTFIIFQKLSIYFVKSYPCLMLQKPERTKIDSLF